ncbi:PQQ-binding-like beta-propeller repeat protein [Actinotalea ferrariae]|uniref:outer membrane protein assembly factor BamB family protein n=1 Tax=Actinotalea ferrariae TaxID=1386098 RepID=UPI001C8C8BF2|nr:PQQ-binding-like beta-propeller repeat protein [Actinotalea ferrariae]MBX9243274.1 PQQ-binding-like beta-propeller repeat protein [Actinotalea ferrariae]
MALPRGPGRAGEVVDVELVDVPSEGAPWSAARRTEGWLDGGAGGGPAGRDRRTRWTRRQRRWALLAACVVLVLVATVATVRQATHDALLAGLGRDGVALLPLDGPLTERWRVEADAVTGDMGPLVLVQDGRRTRALDARTGAVRWQRDDVPVGATEVCRPLEDHASRSTPAVGPQGAAAAVRQAGAVVCLRTSPVGTGAGEVPGGDSPRSTTAAVLDGATGELGRTLTVAGSVVASHVHEGDLVLVTAADDATLRLTRWHPDTGGVRWRREVEPAEAAGLRYAGWQRGVLTVVGRAGTLAYSLDSGRELRVADPLPAHVVAVERRLLPRGGVEVVWGHHEDPAFPGGAGVLVHPGGREVALAGPPLPVAVDDGSAPGLVLVATSPSTVGAVDVSNGDVRWEAEHAASAQVAVRARGLAVLVDGTVASALDVRTGEVLWRVTGLTDRPGALGLTDGERVLLRHTEDGEDRLAAHALRTGEQLWSAVLPEGTDDVLGLAEGRVVAVGPGWIAGLG